MSIFKNLTIISISRYADLKRACIWLRDNKNDWHLANIDLEKSFELEVGHIVDIQKSEISEETKIIKRK